MEADPPNSLGQMVIRASQALGFLLLFYILSIGPVCAVLFRIDGSPFKSHPWLDRFYTPLGWVCDRAPILRDGMMDYMRPWFPAEMRDQLK